MTVCAGGLRGRCHLNCCWMQVLAQTSPGQLRQLARQRVKLSRPAQARRSLAAPGSGLDWKSVLGFTPHSPLGVRQIFCRMASVAVRYLAEAHWHSFSDHREIFSLISSSQHISDQFVWPRHALISDWTLIPIILRQRNWKWDKVCGTSQNAVFLWKESVLRGGGKFQCWHRELFGEWTSFYRNRRIEIALVILILFESEYTHCIQCWNDFTNFYNMLMEIIIMCNSKYFYSLKSWSQFYRYVPFAICYLYQPAKDQSKIAWKYWKQSWHIFRRRDYYKNPVLRMTHYYGHRKNTKSTHTHQLNFMWLLYFFVKYLNAGHKTCGKRSGEKSLQLRNTDTKL